MSQFQIDPPLPDTSSWQPRRNASENLKSAFLKRCIAIEERVRIRVSQERETVIDNYDSGVGTEEIIREEFKGLLPSRYSIRAGVINDKYGHTAGDCDLIIHNEFWFPMIKSGATHESRRAYLPIEGVYAVGEIKQTIDCRVLDEAMEKLVMCQRLHRPPTYAYRLVENRESSPCVHGLTNPLFSFVIATDLKKGVTLEQIVERFFYINKTLKRGEVIRAICVIKQGTVTWGYANETNMEIKPAHFMLDDLYLPIFPIYHRLPDVSSALYPLLVDLFIHLFHSVLAPEDIAPSYGSMEESISVPKSPHVVLEPDPERIDSLNKPCDLKHKTIKVTSSG